MEDGLLIVVGGKRSLGSLNCAVWVDDGRHSIL